MPLPACDPTGTVPCRTNLNFLPDWTGAALYAVTGITLLVTTYGLWSRWRTWKQGTSGMSPGPFWLHLQNLFVVGLCQKKVARRRYAGVMHLLLYTVCIALAIGTTIVALNMDVFSHFDFDVLRGDPYLLF